jgi:predicted ATPase
VEPALRACVAARRATAPGVVSTFVGSVREALTLALVQAEDGAGVGVEVGDDPEGFARVLAVAAHEGQVLASHAVAQLAPTDLPGIAVRAIGEHILADPAARHVLHEVHAAEHVVPARPPRGLSTLPNEIPLQLTSFFGRSAEVMEVAGLTARERLVTVTGPPGVGKTRFAAQVGACVLPAMPGGVWWVDLTTLPPVADDDTLHAAAASVLAARSEHGAVDAEPTLMVLDNAEHMIEATARTARTLLGDHPALHLLVTSRVQLRTAGEHVVPLSPLPHPEVGTGGDLAEVAGFDSVRLFVDRATTVAPEFRLTAANAGLVAEVCRALDGLPLALELAAARLRAGGLEDVARRLTDSLRVLSHGDPTAAERVRTMEATVAWSWSTLAPTERRLLAWLSTFHDGFSLDAAEAVAGDGLGPIEVMDGLASLVECSLVSVTERSGAARYRLLEVVREYAAARLEEIGETTAARDSHLAWARRLAEGLEATVVIQTPEALAGPRREVGNLRGALRRAEELEDPTALCELAGDSWRLWVRLGHLNEANEWLEKARARLADVRPSLRAFVLTPLGHLAYLAGDRVRAIELYREAVAQRRSADHALALASALGDLANALAVTGSLEEADAAFAEALDLAADADSVTARLIYAQWAGALTAAGEPSAAEARYREALSRFGADDPAIGPAMSGGLASLLLKRGGDPREAAGHLTSALEHLLDGADGAALAEGLAIGQALCAALGHVQSAVEVAGALAAWGRAQGELGAAIGANATEAAAQSRRALGRERGRRAWEAGAGRTLQQTAELVLATLKEEGSATGAAAEPSERGVFRRDGEVWLVGLGSERTRLRDGRGPQYLAALVARPGQDVQALDLVAVAGASGGATPDVSATGGAEGGLGPAIDDVARRAYRRRISELQESLDEAVAHADGERAARARAELDALMDQLSSAFGLGGRHRPVGDPAERARKAVTQRVRETLARIREQAPELGRHLDTAIHTGRVCSYKPDRRIDWDL